MQIRLGTLGRRKVSEKNNTGIETRKIQILSNDDNFLPYNAKGIVMYKINPKLYPVKLENLAQLFLILEVSTRGVNLHMS